MTAPAGPRRALIINADDYGLTPSVSAGIRQAHLAGLLTSTTTMMNMPGVAEELERARAECPALGLGVHLVLTKGQPLLPPEAVPSLMGLSGGAGLPGLSALLEGVDRLVAAEVEAEWRAQVEAFVRVTGHPPTHLDSHHHTSFVSPALLGAMLDLARAFGCAIRNPVTNLDTAQRHLGLKPRQYDHLSQYIVPMLAAAADVPHPDHFDVRFFGARASEALLREVLVGLPAGVTELMCHPGLPDAALAEVSSYHRHRAQELEALTAPGLREAAAAAGVKLAHFGVLG